MQPPTHPPPIPITPNPNPQQIKLPTKPPLTPHLPPPLPSGASSPVHLTQDLLDTFRTNVIGPIHLVNSFLPLIRQGSARKVVLISSGHADPALPRDYGVHEAAPYSVSKAALNMVAAKYAASLGAGSEQGGKGGILCFAMSPGYVDTGVYESGKFLTFCFLFPFLSRFIVHYARGPKLTVRPNRQSARGVAAQGRGSGGQVRGLRASLHGPLDAGGVSPRNEVGD